MAKPSGGHLSQEQEERARRLVSATPDFPKKGIVFLSVHPLFTHADGLALVVGAFTARYAPARGGGDDFFIAGVDARGFPAAAAVAAALHVGFVMVRKARAKLPPPVLSLKYSLEYGEDAMEVPRDVFSACAHPRVVVLDDLVATGGTMAAGCELLRMAGAEVVEAGTVLELCALAGRKTLQGAGVPLHALLQYDE